MYKITKIANRATKKLMIEYWKEDGNGRETVDRGTIRSELTISVPECGNSDDYNHGKYARLNLEGHSSDAWIRLFHHEGQLYFTRQEQSGFDAKRRFPILKEDVATEQHLKLIVNYEMISAPAAIDGGVWIIGVTDSIFDDLID